MRPVIDLNTPALVAGDEMEAVIDRIGAAARAGVHLIQIRLRGVEGGALVRVVERTVAAVRGTDARILVNDRVDVALAAGAAGVHLRGASMPARRVRAIVPRGFVVGRSVHSATEAAEAVAEGGLDFLMLGTVFETASKPGVAPVGTAGLAAACAAVALPVLAVGGMTPSRLAAVGSAGASGFAAIGLFADTPIDRLTAVVREAIAAYENR